MGCRQVCASASDSLALNSAPYLIRHRVEWGNKRLSKLLGELICADAESRRLWTLLGVL